MNKINNVVLSTRERRERTNPGRREDSKETEGKIGRRPVKTHRKKSRSNSSFCETALSRKILAREICKKNLLHLKIDRWMLFLPLFWDTMKLLLNFRTLLAQPIFSVVIAGRVALSDP